MLRPKLISSPRLTTLTLGCLALLLVLCIIIYPDQAFQSSLQGLSIWWQLVFPALLPFLILTEMLRGMGILHGLGAFLEPLLRFFFRLPGVGGWVIALGLTSGAPSGAIVVGSLRRDKLVTRDEGERLLALTHVSSPVFFIAIVGVGFLHNAQAGLALALLHYGSAVATAVIERFSYARRIAEREVVMNRRAEARAQPSGGLIARSAGAVKAAQAADGRTFGKLLGDSVSQSVQHLMAVGGLIMMFSVLIHAVSLSGIISVLGTLLSGLGFGSVSELERMFSTLMPGLFETHLGAYSLAAGVSVPDSWQAALFSALFAWGGLSGHAQVKSFTMNTDMRYSAFLRSRLLHAAVSFLSAAACWQPLVGWLQQVAAPTFLPFSAEPYTVLTLRQFNLWPLLSPLMMWFSGILLLLLVLSVFVAFAFRPGSRHPNGKS